jgi:hypothetical protein
MTTSAAATIGTGHEPYPGFRHVEIVHSVIRENGDAEIAFWGY